MQSVCREFIANLKLPDDLSVAWALAQREDAVQRIIAECLDAPDVDALNVRVTMGAPLDGYADDATSHEIAADVCQRLADAFASAAERIASIEPQSRKGSLECFQ